MRFDMFKIVRNNLNIVFAIGGILIVVNILSGQENYWVWVLAIGFIIVAYDFEQNIAVNLKNNFHRLLALLMVACIYFDKSLYFIVLCWAVGVCLAKSDIKKR